MPNRTFNNNKIPTVPRIEQLLELHHRTLLKSSFKSSAATIIAMIGISGLGITLFVILKSTLYLWVFIALSTLIGVLTSKIRNQASNFGLTNAATKKIARYYEDAFSIIKEANLTDISSIALAIIQHLPKFKKTDEVFFKLADKCFQFHLAKLVQIAIAINLSDKQQINLPHNKMIDIPKTLQEAAIFFADQLKIIQDAVKQNFDEQNTTNKNSGAFASLEQSLQQGLEQGYKLAELKI